MAKWLQVAFAWKASKGLKLGLTIQLFWLRKKPEETISSACILAGRVLRTAAPGSAGAPGAVAHPRTGGWISPTRDATVPESGTRTPTHAALRTRVCLPPCPHKQFPPANPHKRHEIQPRMGRQPALPPHPLPPGLCYDHLRPHFVKFQPQLPLVQKHFDPLHALRGRKAQAVRPKRCGENRAGGNRGGGGGAPHGPNGKLGGKRPGDGSRSSGCSRENPAPKPGRTGFQAAAR